MAQAREGMASQIWSETEWRVKGASEGQSELHMMILIRGKGEKKTMGT